MTTDPADRLLRTACATTAALAPAAVSIPLLLAPRNLPMFRPTHAIAAFPFELLAFTTTVAVICAFALTVRRLKPRDQQWIPSALFVVAVLWSANFIAEFSARSDDYECYRAAADAIRHGTSPYSQPAFDYIYPPLLAQLLAWTSAAIERLAPTLSTTDAVFYLYQATQMVLVATLFPLLYTLLRRFGASAVFASVVALAAIVIDVPLTRALIGNQIVLAVLVLSLVAVLCRDRPVVAGLAIAIGVHLKLYPLLLLPVFWLFGYRRAVIASALAMFPPFLLPGTVSAWRELIPRLGHLGQGSFANSSVWSLAYNMSAWTGADAGGAQAIARVAQTAAAITAVGWMVYRLRGHRSNPSGFLSAASEWMALMVLVSPLAWEHAFVLAIPFAALTSVHIGANRRVVFLVAVAAVFLIPVFGVFLIGDHRLAGLITMLVLTPPGTTGGSWTRRSKSRPPEDLTGGPAGPSS